MASPSTTITVNINKTKVKEFAGWNGPVGQSVERLAKLTVKQQQLLGPKRTGRLAESIHYSKGKTPLGITFTTTSRLKYADWMERGTRPHIIRPKKAGGVLVFNWPKAGGKVFLKVVHHPGTRPYRFLERGLQIAMKLWNR